MKIEKIVGTMMGLAVGDALGVPVEFVNAEDIRKRYGVLDKMTGGGTWGQEAGTVSDDTAMALAVAEGIVNNANNPVPEIGKRFIDWYKGRPFDIGFCCASVIQQMEDLEGADAYDWFNASKDYDVESGGRSAGNGGLMRTAFVGCYYREPKNVEYYAKDICRMTHYDEGAQLDCCLLSLIIHKLIDGGTKEDIENLVMKYEIRYNLGEIEGYPFRVEPSGKSWNSLACALKCVLATRSFKDAVVMAVNMGGDADTIGAITGAMAGALYGDEEIPVEWKNALKRDVRTKILDVCSYAGINRMGGVDNALKEVVEMLDRKLQKEGV